MNMDEITDKFRVLDADKVKIVGGVAAGIGAVAALPVMVNASIRLLPIGIRLGKSGICGGGTGGVSAGAGAGATGSSASTGVGARGLS